MAETKSKRHAHNFIDLSGRKFGFLTVTSFAETRGKVPYWNVVCDCGATNVVAGNNLTSGGSTRCGYSCPLRIDPRLKDETGKVYGKLTVLGYAGRSLKSHKGGYWRCRCECGTELVVVGVTLRNGKTRSCSAGCGMTTHGMRGTPEYHCWQDMRFRCTVPTNPGFNNWGGRGITVCDRWLNSFENFLADMGMKPEGNRISIGRIDNDGPYSPENCRWETQEQQQNNTRTNHYITHDGVTLTVTQWARKLGIHPNTLSNRLSCGWSTTKAITTPVQYHSPSCH